MPILRPSLSTVFTTPSGDAQSLNVNCADYTHIRWPWKATNVTTIATPNAVTTSSVVAHPEDIYVSGTDTSTGTNTQIVLRTMFAYIADLPFLISGETNYNTSFISATDTVISTTFNIYTKLFYLDGTLHTELFNESVSLSDPNPASRTASGVRRFYATLPATTCPLVVFSWLQNTGTISPPLTSKTVAGDIRLKLGNTSAEIAVERDGSDIPLNGTFNLGSVHAGGTVQRTFNIRNYGTSNLTLSSNPRVLIGGDTTSFYVVSQPAASITGSGGSSPFTIQFSPLTAGVKQAAVYIDNSDSNEDPFVFNITGTADPSGEISVEQPLNTNILNNSTVNFGDVQVANSKTLRFTIKNISTSLLYLTGSPRVLIQGAGTTSFQVTLQPWSNSISGNGLMWFDVKFDPDNMGTKTVNLSIINSDGDENPFNLTLTGRGVF